MAVSGAAPQPLTAQEALARLVAGNECFVRGEALEVLAELAKGKILRTPPERSSHDIRLPTATRSHLR